MLSSIYLLRGRLHLFPMQARMHLVQMNMARMRLVCRFVERMHQ